MWILDFFQRRPFILSGFFCYHLKHIQFSKISQFPVCAFMYGTFALGNRNTYTVRKRVTVVAVFCVILSGYVIFFPGMLYDVSKVHYLRHDDRFFCWRKLAFLLPPPNKVFFLYHLFSLSGCSFYSSFLFYSLFCHRISLHFFSYFKRNFFLFCFFPFAPRCVCVCCLVFSLYTA